MNSLLLKYDSILGVPAALIVDQIAGRRKAREKIPLLHNTKNIIYPPGINMEQCSSEATARFKADVVNELVKFSDSCVDLTGGFGIDAFFLHDKFREVHMVEPNPQLLAIGAHNHELLGAENIQYYQTTAAEFLAGSSSFSLIYADPSRRDKANRKVYSLADCEPDITALQEPVFERSQFLLVKASPLLDIQKGLSELHYVSHVFVVSVQNECKELLFLSRKDFAGSSSITAVNIGKDIASFTFSYADEHSATVSFSDPLEYLYEPNAALLKAGAFKLIAKEFDLQKLDPNTHLYTSKVLITGFPGKVFRILALVKPRPKSLSTYFPEGKANVSVRNYPMSVQALRDATGLEDGGNRFLLGFSGVKAKFLVAGERIY